MRKKAVNCPTFEKDIKDEAMAHKEYSDASKHSKDHLDKAQYYSMSEDEKRHKGFLIRMQSKYCKK